MKETVEKRERERRKRVLGLLHDIIFFFFFFLIFNQYFERGKPQRKTKIAVLAKIVMGRQFSFFVFYFECESSELLLFLFTCESEMTLMYRVC